MNENDQIFLEFWKNYKWPEPVAVFYRLYYNDNGDPIVYSMEDLPGKYIELTAEQYHEHNYCVRIKDGKLIKKISGSVATKKLVPSVAGTPCHPATITIVVNDDLAQRWKLKNYDND
jgi:hypothetical protein